jgi:hypothetical protein
MEAGRFSAATGNPNPSRRLVMKNRLAALLAAVLLVPCAPAQEKADEALAKAMKEADVLFTGKVGKVNPLGQTNSIPPSTFGTVAFKDPKALLGKVPDGATFSYAFKEGTTKNLDLDAKGDVVVAVKGKGVTVIVPATEANLALARKAAEAHRDK